ncbi:MAG: hypothetical protein KY464_17390 [Gemmatimonadetes bacterium]|nr:hypothetical protein [Gemmatimonadota bacterium]
MAPFKAEASTRLKYNDEWYAPGDAVVFKSKEEAQPYTDSGAIGAGTEESPAAPTGPAPPRAGLEGIDFASDEAGEAASTAKLTSADFAGLKPSGQGGYTKADVQQVVAKQAK